MAISSSIDLNAIETEELIGGLTKVYYKSRVIGTVEERKNTIWVATSLHPEFGNPTGNSMFGEFQAAVEWVVVKVAPLVEVRLRQPQEPATAQ